jgi:predicted kinase
VVDYYIVHRALVRAAVAGVAAMETELGVEERRRAAKSAGDHLRLVEQLLSRRASPLLVIMCGMVGTGKSTVAETAADLLCGAVVSSDRTRKRLAGIDPEARATAAAGEGIYSPEHTTLVYDGLIERAEPVLGRGRAVVLDATYSRAEWRRRVQDWAREHGYHALLLEVRCREEVVLSRLEKRLTDTHRVSDAGPDFFAESARSFEPPTEWPVGDHLVVDSDRADWRDQLSAALRPFGSRPHIQGSS